MADAPPQTRDAPSSNQATPEVPNRRFNRDTFNGGAMVNPFNKGSIYASAENLKYPMLLNDSAGEFTQWIAFYPLVREGTSQALALAAQGRGAVFETSGQQRVDAEHAQAAGTAQGVVLGGQTGGVAGLADIKDALGGTGGLASFFRAAGTAAAKTIGGAVLGGIGGAALNAIGARRLIMGSKAVVLGIQDKLSYGYSANYDVADLGGIVGAAATGNFSGEASLGDAAYDTGALAARKLAKLAGAIGGNSVTNLKEATSKAVENPYKEQLFKNMGFRKFGFEYKFAPRSREEGEKIFGRNGIIETFINHMHPEPSDAGVFLIYPSEFLIIIYHNKGDSVKENTYVRKISNCALTGFNIEYGAEGFTTFQGTDGMPTEATIRLEFTELETLTNKRTSRGY
jgi:hypothetical protein